jgi:hypothetical protein
MNRASEESPLIVCARYLVSENRSSDLPVKERLKIQKRTLYGRLLDLLYPLGWPGGFVFLLFSVIKRDSVKLYRNMIIADHASRVIHGALSRVWGREYKQQLVKSRASLFETYRALFRKRALLKKAYKAAEVAHVTEYVRLVRLFHFYLVWTAWFSRNRPQAALMARTNDQNRLALGVAAEEAGVPCAAFTIHRVTLLKPVPFAVQTAFCWTARQASEHAVAGIRAVRMPVPLLKELKLPVPENGTGRFGLLLNAKCDVQKLDAWLTALKKQSEIREILLRPHPGYDTEKLTSLSFGTLSDWRQPLPQYLDSLDLVFALNTHAVIDALLHGVPVVYVGGLDPYEYDLHGFVKSGIAYPWSLSDTFPGAVNRFYSSEGFKSRWNPSEFETDGGGERRALLELAGEGKGKEGTE